MNATRSVHNQSQPATSTSSHPPSSFWSARKEYEATKHILRSNPSLPDLTAEGSIRKPKAVAIPTTRTPGSSSDREATTSTSMHRSARSVDPVKSERPPSRGTTPPTRQTKEDIERQKAKKGNTVPTHEPSSSWSSLRPFRRKESRESLVDEYTPVVSTVQTASGSPPQSSSVRRLRSLGFLRRKNSSVSATSSPSSTSLVSQNQTNVTTTPSGSSHGHSNSSNSTSSNASHALPIQHQPHTQTVSASTVFPSLKSGTSFTVTKTLTSSLVASSSTSTDLTSTSFARPPKASPSIRRSISLYEAKSPRHEQGPTALSASRSRNGIKRPIVIPPTSTTVVARTPCTYDVTHRRPIRPRSSSLPLDSAVLANQLKSLKTREQDSPSTQSQLLPSDSGTPPAMHTPPSTSSSTTRPSTPRTQNRYASVYRPPPMLDANGYARPGHPKPALSLSMPSGVAIIEPLKPSASPTVRVGSGNQSLAGNGNLSGSEKTAVNSNLNSNTNNILNGNGNLNNAKSTIGSAGPSSSGPGSSSLTVPNSPFPALATPGTPHTPRTPHTPHTPHTPYSAYTITAPLASPYSIGSPSSTSVRPPPRAPVPVSPGASPEQRATKPLPPVSILSPPVSATLSARFESSSHGSPKLGQPSTPHSARSTPTPTHPVHPLHPLTPTNSGRGSGNAHGLSGLHARAVATTTSSTTAASTIANANPSVNAMTSAINTSSGGSKVPTSLAGPGRPTDNLNENSNVHTVTGTNSGANTTTTTTTTTKTGVSGIDIAKWTAEVNAQLKINVNNLHGTNQTNEAAPSSLSIPSIATERIGGEPRTIYRAPPTLELAPVSPTSYNPMRRPSLPILSTTSHSSLLSPNSLLPHPHSQAVGKNASATTAIPSSLSSILGGKAAGAAVPVGVTVPSPSPEPSIMEDEEVLWKYFEKKGLASSAGPTSTPPPIPSSIPPHVATSAPNSSLLPGRSLSASAVLSRPVQPPPSLPPSLPLPPVPTARPPNAPLPAIPVSARKNSVSNSPFSPQSSSSLRTPPLSTGVSPSTPHTPYTPASTSANPTNVAGTSAMAIPPAITTTGPPKMLRRTRHTVSHSSSAALPSPSAQSTKSTFLPTNSVFLQSQTLYLPSSPLSPPPQSTFLPSPGGTDALETFPLTPFTPNFFSRESMSKDGHEEPRSSTTPKQAAKQYSDTESQILPISPPVSLRADEV